MEVDVFPIRNIVAVSAGNRHTVGLREDGTVVAVGDMNNEFKPFDLKLISESKEPSGGQFITVSDSGTHSEPYGTIITNVYECP